MENTEDYTSRIQIVLVEPQDGANIGSVCRAMKTMGLTNLAIVGDRVYDEGRVRTLAIHAADLWENATRYATLDEALQDSSFSVGATRRRGRYRKMTSFSPEQLAEKIKTIPEGKVSIVFGRESDGLRDDEVNKCASIVTIPTSDLFPSLNLSQAVQIICYALFTGGMQYKTGIVAVDKTRIKKAVGKMSGLLEGIGYYKQDDEKKWTEQFLCDMIERTTPSEGELKRLEKIFSKTISIALFKDREEKEETVPEEKN